MAGKNQSCPLCGYCIKRPEGWLTKWRGKSAHIGCVSQWIKARKETEEILRRIHLE